MKNLKADKLTSPPRWNLDQKAANNARPLPDFENIKKKKILAINPPVYDFAYFDLWAKPIGLLNFLAWIRKNNEISYIDCIYEGREKEIDYGRWKIYKEERKKPAAYKDIPRRYFRFGLNEDDFIKQLEKEPEPDFILLSSIMTYWYLGVEETIRHIRAVFPQKKIILGGIYATLCYEHALNLGADYILPCGQSPYAAHTPMDLYQKPSYGILSSSRGCPRRCHYCASSILHPRFQERTLDEIKADLDQQMRHSSITDLAFYDDALLWKREEIFYPICHYISEKYPYLRLHSPNGLSVDGLDEKTCQIMRQTGFKTLRLSFEGLDQSTQKASESKVSSESFLKALDNLKAAGYQAEEIETYLLIGLPEQKIEDIEMSIEFVKQAGAKAKLCEYSPIPGTALFSKEAKLNPMILKEPLWHNNTVYSTYLSGRLTIEELQGLKKLSLASKRHCHHP